AHGVEQQGRAMTQAIAALPLFEIQIGAPVGIPQPGALATNEYRCGVLAHQLQPCHTITHNDAPPRQPLPPTAGRAGVPTSSPDGHCADLARRSRASVLTAPDTSAIAASRRAPWANGRNAARPARRSGSDSCVAPAGMASRC